jgi:hypothetical protein
VPPSGIVVPPSGIVVPPSGIVVPPSGRTVLSGMTSPSGRDVLPSDTGALRSGLVVASVDDVASSFAPDPSTTGAPLSNRGCVAPSSTLQLTIGATTQIIAPRNRECRA